MKSHFHTPFLVIATITSIALQLISPSLQSPDSTPTPTPTIWPEQFYALLFTNFSTGKLLISSLWYDWPKRRNVYLRQEQLAVPFYDVEWNNGTSFFFSLEEPYFCNVVEFGVGIPRPDFLEGANYLGTAVADGFSCNVWEKSDFIWYYEDVYTKRPVKWDFSDGITTHVMTFEVGTVVNSSLTQAPAYCFSQDKHVNLRWKIPYGMAS